MISTNRPITINNAPLRNANVKIDQANNQVTQVVIQGTNQQGEHVGVTLTSPQDIQNLQRAAGVNSPAADQLAAALKENANPMNMQVSVNP